MTPSSGSNVPRAKRRKLNIVIGGEPQVTSATSASLSRPVSPPISRRKSPALGSTSLLVPAPTWGFNNVPKRILTPPPSQPPLELRQANQSAPEPIAEPIEGDKQKKDDRVAQDGHRRIASPFQLTKIRDLASHQNVDTIKLKDILGDPLIKECWNFNFLFDLDFVMQQFDEDVRDLVKVKIIHGFWKRDDERRIRMMESAERYSNMEVISAYLPDPFGTHHSKMLILFRHDDHAQIIIHTANMIAKDWTNMTQAVWTSPLMHLSQVSPSMGPHAIGSGVRFHTDLRQYLLKYEKRLQRLVDQLAEYDFSEIRAAFLGSAPSRQAVSEAKPALQTSFGWLGLQEILSNIPITATLGAAPTWLSHLQSVLSRSRTPQRLANVSQPKFNIIFPTTEEVRTSLDGYESGGSIHVKLQSSQQQKQLQYMHPLLCHWKHPCSSTSANASEPRKEAHRGAAAPHIKTYIRFTDDTHKSIDWALVTSANLSKQAWGDVMNKQGEVRVQSYEAGVLVWPELFEDGCDRGGWVASMVPTFGKDMPDEHHSPEETSRSDQNTDGVGEDEDDDETEDESEELLHQSKPQQGQGKKKAIPRDKKRIIVGVRMPYNLPLSSYSAQDVPWCATQQYTEPDWKGRTWGGF